MAVDIIARAMAAKNVNIFGIPAGVTADQLEIISSTRSLVIDQPVYVNKPITLSGHVTVTGAGAIITTGTGSVSFQTQPSLPDREIFGGTRNITGLLAAKDLWFAASVLNTGNNALTRLQAAIDSVVDGGVIDISAGSYTITGLTPLVVSRGQSIIGAGMFNTRIAYTTATTNVFSIVNTVSALIAEMSMGLNTYDIWPTAGSAIEMAAGYSEVRNVLIERSYIAIYNHGTSATRITGSHLFDSASAGIVLDTVNEVFTDSCVISAGVDRLEITDIVGTFQEGELLTGSTSSAKINLQNNMLNAASGPALRVTVNDEINPVVGETLTGGTSGATCKLVQFRRNHWDGAIRHTNKVEFAMTSNVSVIGGRYGLWIDAAVYSAGVRPAYNEFNNVGFDSADEPARINNCVEVDFVGCWFSNRPESGFWIGQVDGVGFIGGRTVNNAKHGGYISALATNVVFSAKFAARGNSKLSAGVYDGLYFEDGCSGFSVIACVLGGAIGFGLQRFGVRVSSATNDHYTIMGNVGRGNQAGVVSDATSNSTRFVSANHQ